MGNQGRRHAYLDRIASSKPARAVVANTRERQLFMSAGVCLGGEMFEVRGRAIVRYYRRSPETNETSRSLRWEGIVKLLTVGPFLVATMSSTIAQHAMPSNQEAMDRIKESAPPEVVKGATILNMADDG
jgi:hypothetical protein